MAREKISGIYIIENLVNGKVYVGSSINIVRRWQDHISSLCRCKHYNKHLQYAWCQHGKDNFRFEIIERGLPGHLLADRENCWMNAYNSLSTSYGYNVAVDTVCPLRGSKWTNESKNKMHASLQKYLNTKFVYKKYKFIDPEGTVVVVDHLSNFCKKHNLDARHMVAFTGRKSHKGWRPFLDSEIGVKHCLGIPKKSYDLVSPDGVRMQGEGIREFCREHNLVSQCIGYLLSGKQNKHKGWTKYKQEGVVQ